MRFFSALLALSLFAASQATEIEGLIRRSSTTEWCGCFSGSVSVTSVTTPGQKVSCGSLSTTVCICESQIVDFLYSGSDITKNILKFGGHNNGLSCIAELIARDLSYYQKCTFPGNSQSKCSKTNVCDFQCQNGFSKSGSTCYCPKSQNLCGNGNCQSQACPSGVASLPHKRDLAYWGKQTQKACKAGWSACGVIGGGPRDWECVDTQRDLESCGGCPMDLLTSPTGQGLGVDCTTLPGVADVSCRSGVCAVHRCLPGYKVSRSGQHCEEVNGVLSDAMRIVEAVKIIGMDYSP